jgi:hypothetical protein
MSGPQYWDTADTARAATALTWFDAAPRRHGDHSHLGAKRPDHLPMHRYAPSELADILEKLAPGLLAPLPSERLAHQTPKGAVQDFQISIFINKEQTA